MQMMDDARPILSEDYLQARSWRYFRENGSEASQFFKLLPDGTISGLRHKSERYWKFEGGILSLLNDQRAATVHFDEMEVVEGKLLLKGRHVARPEFTMCLSEQIGRVRHNPTRNALAEEIALLGWSIGNHTYGVPLFVGKAGSKLRIGHYCSLALGVTIALQDHRTDTFTTYPFKNRKRFWENVPPDVKDHFTKGDVVIGSDVWVGKDAFIGSGVTVGSGAVIGAMSVVVKDVPPYAIVVGNPARVVKYRFEPSIIEELLDIGWWDFPDELVDELLPKLMSSDIETVMPALRQARASL